MGDSRSLAEQLHARESERASRAGSLIYWLSAVLLLAATFALTSPDNRFEAEDALSWAGAIEFGEEASELVSPHHLAYLPIGNVLYEGFNRSGLVDRALPLLVWMSAFAAAGASVLFVQLLRSWLEVGWRLAVFGGAGLAGSYGFWRYAGEAEVYSLAALIAVALVLVAIRMTPSLRGAFAIAALATLAILGHTVNAAVVAALPYLLLKRGWPIRRLALIGIIGAGMLVTTLWVGYQVADQAVASQDTGFVGFYTGTSLDTNLDARDVIPAIGVIGSLVVAANAVFLYESTRELVVSTFPGRALADELHMGVTAAEWLRWIAPLALVGVLAAGVILILRLNYRSVIKSVEGRFLSIWIVAYSLVVAFGGVLTQPEVWLLLLIPLWALVIVGLRERPPSSFFLTLVVLAIASNSLVGGLLPVYTGEDRRADLTLWLNENTSSSDLVITADGAGLARYIAYHRPAHAVHIGGRGNEERTLDSIDRIAKMIKAGATTHDILLSLEQMGMLSGHRKIVDRASGDLYLTTDFFDPPGWLATEEPEAAARLAELEGELGPLFDDVAGSDYYLIRVRDP